MPNKNQVVSSSDRAVRVSDDAWNILFRFPGIPHEAKEKLQAEQGSSSSQVFRDPLQSRLEEILVDVDVATHSGMKFISVLMLLDEMLMRYHQQLPGGETVTRSKAGQLLLLLSYWLD